MRLPNQINSDLNAWGYGDSNISSQFRLHCVVDQESNMPLYYRNISGGLADVPTLVATISELRYLV